MPCPVVFSILAGNSMCPLSTHTALEKKPDIDASKRPTEHFFGAHKSITPNGGNFSNGKILPTLGHYVHT